MKIAIELTDRELKEVHYAIDKQLEEVKYEIEEIENTTALQTKKILLESSLSKLNIAYDYEKRLKNNSINKDLHELISQYNSTKEKILSYVDCSAVTQTPRSVIKGENGDTYTIAYEDGIWSVD